ncbi:MAG TPA: uroporphyrinogen-III C-methyltransferase [Thermodesulfobacteriota bacterium]|nr:uroporphyrinogen-III C-methyltransferase [Thermodesulfobacteriota bacterium]
MKQGKVYLVGAGPGDPGLMTVKGLNCLRHADVVIYDRLVDESLLSEVHPEAEKIFVGKADRLHILEQDSINQLLLEKAREGKVVVRLKGGDPFVLGRGGEEAGILRKHGIPFEVVPGVTSASAVPAYAGIPITHREVASSFAVITGHKASDRGEPRISWDKLATGTDTLVILMGMRNLSKIVRELMRHGRSPSTPVAVITQGTTSRQRCLVGTLQDIVDRVAKENLQPPSVVVVGEVVQFRETLRWFEEQTPLEILGER